MRNKIDNICSKQFSTILDEFNKFHINNLGYICLDSTYLAKILQNNGIKDTTLITIKNNLRNNKQHLIHLLTNNENFIIFESFIISSILLVLTILSSKKIIVFLTKFLSN